MRSHVILINETSRLRFHVRGYKKDGSTRSVETRIANSLVKWNTANRRKSMLPLSRCFIFQKCRLPYNGSATEQWDFFSNFLFSCIGFTETRPRRVTRSWRKNNIIYIPRRGFALFRSAEPFRRSEKSSFSNSFCHPTLWTTFRCHSQLSSGSLFHVLPAKFTSKDYSFN